MDDIIDKMRTKRNVSESTLKSYRRHLNKILKLSEGENITDLGNCEKVLGLLEESDSSVASVRAYLASLVVCMDAHDMLEEGEKYRKAMMNYLVKEKDNMNKHEKTEVQKENWATMKELNDCIKTYEKQIKNQKIMKKDTLTKKEKEYLQSYVCAMLYAGDPVNHQPVRLDYSPMIVIGEKDYDEKIKNDVLPSGVNFLVVKSRNKKTFVFHNYKTVKKYGIRKVPLSPKINSAVNKLLKYNVTNYLFENHLARPLTSNALGKLLTTAFMPTGKKITINLIRHIYITEKYPVEKTKEQEEDAEKMLHSVATQKLYAKHEE